MDRVILPNGVDEWIKGVDESRVTRYKLFPIGTYLIKEDGKLYKYVMAEDSYKWK